VRMHKYIHQAYNTIIEVKIELLQLMFIVYKT
jgi:hypothetical protein